MTTVIHKKDSTRAPDEVYIGRGSIYGNPWTSKPLWNTKATFQALNRGDALYQYEAWIRGTAHIGVEQERRAKIRANIARLKGKVLVCYCRPAECHGDVLIKLLNENWAIIEAEATELK